MEWHRGKQPMSGRQWPLLGLLLVVLFLGHDVLMAAEAVAAPLHVAATAHHASGPHALKRDAPAPQTQSHTPEPGHPENCSIGQSAMPRSSNDIGCADQALAARDGFTVAGDSCQVHAGVFLWEEPHWPPGTLRALFQVYRI